MKRVKYRKGWSKRPVEERFMVMTGKAVCEECGADTELRFGGWVDSTLVPDGCDCCQPVWARWVRKYYLEQTFGVVVEGS